MSKVIQAFPELFSESVEAKVYAVAARDYLGTSDGLPSSFPQYTEPDTRPPHSYQFTPARFWTSGFFPGSIWLLYERAKVLGHSSGKIPDEEWKDLAVRWTEPLRAQADRRDTHDIGFLFMPTFFKRMMTGVDPEDSKSVALQTADGLASRFNDYVGCTRSWDQSGHLVNGEKREDMDKHFLVIIDNMMNLDLLYAAHYLRDAPSTEGQSLADIATTHALTTIANHFHPDGGTYHVLNYNQKAGAEPKIFKRWAAQGYSDDSTWARGEAWALHGFAHCAEWTDILKRRELGQDVTLGYGNLECTANDGFFGRQEFVEQAKVVADYFIRKLGEGKEAVPPWDFNAPNNPDGSLTFRDVSAGMIAASGMITLHCILRRTGATSPYLSAALNIICATLKYCSTPEAKFLENKAIDLGEGEWDTILNQSTINYNANARRRWADCGLVYADYYFLEIGNKLLEMERRGWLESDWESV